MVRYLNGLKLSKKAEDKELFKVKLSSKICATNLQTDLDNAYKWSQT